MVTQKDYFRQDPGFICRGQPSLSRCFEKLENLYPDINSLD